MGAGVETVLAGNGKTPKYSLDTGARLDNSPLDMAVRDLESGARRGQR